MKKILHIPNYFYPNHGGIEDACYSIVQMMPEYKHEVFCFNHLKFTKLSKDYVGNIKVTRTPIVGQLSSQPIAIKYFFHLKNAVKNFAPDIVHFHVPNPLGSLALLLVMRTYKFKLVVHWHSDIVSQSFLYKLVKPIEKRLLESANKIIATSELYLQASKPIAPHTLKAVVIPNVVSLEKIKYRQEDSSLIKKINEKYGENIVFFVGRHVPYKGLKYLIEAEKYVETNSSFVIAGEGELTNQLKQISVGKRVHFIGKISNDELRCFFYASKVFAFPSISRNEAFGVALAESLYCGCPAVTFTIQGSGVNWVNQNEYTGIEVESANSKELGKAISTLLSNNDMRERLSKQAIKWASENFTEENVKHKYYQLYENLMLT